MSIDTLTFTLHCDFERVAALLRGFGWDTFEKRAGGSRFCHEVYDGAHGLRVDALPRDERQNWCSVSLMGEGCGWLGYEGVSGLLIALGELARSGVKLSFTRVDVASDTQGFAASWFARALRDGAVDRRSLAFEVIESQGGGCTVYLGAPSSEKRLRCYHKMDGSTFGEGVHFTRVEMQYRGAAAVGVAAHFMVTEPQDWGRLASGLLVDFVEVKKRWWRSFVGALGRAALVCKRVRSTVEKQRAWLMRQVAPALALVVDALSVAVPSSGRVFIEALLLDGRRRRTGLQRVLVRENVADGLPALAIFEL